MYRLSHTEIPLLPNTFVSPVNLVLGSVDSVDSLDSVEIDSVDSVLGS